MSSRRARDTSMPQVASVVLFLLLIVAVSRDWLGLQGPAAAFSEAVGGVLVALAGLISDSVSWLLQETVGKVFDQPETA